MRIFVTRALRHASTAAVLTLTLFLAADAQTAQATPLTIVESTDFSNTAPGNSLGSLDVGVNTISGKVNGATDLADYFQVTLPALMGLVRLEFDIANFRLSYSTSDNATVSLHKGSLDVPAFGFLDLGGNVIGTVTAAPGFSLISGPATLDFAFLSPFVEFLSGTGADLSGYDYHVALTVNGPSSTVPEPATLTLTALGLAGAVARYRRRDFRSEA